MSPISAAYPLAAGTRVGRLVADHETLRREATELMVLAEHGRTPDRGHCDALVERLGRLCERLGEHFALEEDGGYLHDVVIRRPDLEPRVAGLQREHATFLTEGATLTRHLLAARAPRDTMPRVVRLLEALRRHEIAEHDLLQQAFLDDLGSGG